MFARWPASAKIFLKGDGLARRRRPLVQADLAATLEAIAAKGPAGFYEGTTAEKLVDAIRADGGIMTLDDLRLSPGDPHAGARHLSRL